MPSEDFEILVEDVKFYIKVSERGYEVSCAGNVNGILSAIYSPVSTIEEVKEVCERHVQMIKNEFQNFNRNKKTLENIDWAKPVKITRPIESYLPSHKVMNIPL